MSERAYKNVTTMTDGKPGAYEPARRGHLVRASKSAIGRRRAKRDYEGRR